MQQLQQKQRAPARRWWYSYGSDINVRFILTYDLIQNLQHSNSCRIWQIVLHWILISGLRKRHPPK